MHHMVRRVRGRESPEGDIFVRSHASPSRNARLELFRRRDFFLEKRGSYRGRGRAVLRFRILLEFRIGGRVVRKHGSVHGLDVVFLGGGFRGVRVFFQDSEGSDTLVNRCRFGGIGHGRNLAETWNFLRFAPGQARVRVTRFRDDRTIQRLREPARSRNRHPDYEMEGLKKILLELAVAGIAFRRNLLFRQPYRVHGGHFLWTPACRCEILEIRGDFRRGVARDRRGIFEDRSPDFRSRDGFRFFQGAFVRRRGLRNMKIFRFRNLAWEMIRIPGIRASERVFPKIPRVRADRFHSRPYPFGIPGCFRSNGSRRIPLLYRHPSRVPLISADRFRPSPKAEPGVCRGRVFLSEFGGIL